MGIISLNKQNAKIDIRKFQKGKKITIVIILINFIYSFVNFVVLITTYDSITFLKQLLILTLTVVISYLFYKGFDFAKWISLALLVPPFLTITFYLVKPVSVFGLSGGWVRSVIIILLAIGGGILLGRTESLYVFMHEQRNMENRLKK